MVAVHIYIAKCTLFYMSALWKCGCPMLTCRKEDLFIEIPYCNRPCTLTSLLQQNQCDIGFIPSSIPEHRYVCNYV